MAVGDRNEKGKPTDRVWHYVPKDSDKTSCGKRLENVCIIKEEWNDDKAYHNIEDVTCLKCLKKMARG